MACGAEMLTHQNFGRAESRCGIDRHNVQLTCMTSSCDVGLGYTMSRVCDSWV